GNSGRHLDGTVCRCPSSDVCRRIASYWRNAVGTRLVLGTACGFDHDSILDLATLRRRTIPFQESHRLYRIFRTSPLAFDSGSLLIRFVSPDIETRPSRSGNQSSSKALSMTAFLKPPKLQIGTPC